MAAVTWKDDVEFMIPLIMLTWLRQLQQFFKKKNNRHSWSVLGNYTPIEKYSGGEGRDPLSLVYLSKPDAGISVKVTKYTDITTGESYNMNGKDIAIKSLEEWAMFILQPPVEKKLTNAAKTDSETEMRYNRIKKLINQKHRFRLTEKDYTETKKKPVKINEPTVQPKYDYSDETIHELHSVINDGLLYGQEVATKLEKKTKPTADDMKMILTMKKISQAYVQLANNTFKDENNAETFKTLDNIKDHLDSKLWEKLKNF